MFSGFERARVDVGDDVRIDIARKGNGPPLLLLHGYPQTKAMWHKIAPALAERFTVIAADLRGYGDSSKPPGGSDHRNYGKRAMASDQVVMMKELGFESFYLAGHDRGGRVAHRLAADHPAAVRKLAVLDIAPTYAMYTTTDMEFANAYYHWFFLIQPFDLPERLIGADPEYFMRRKLGQWGRNSSAFTSEAMSEYLRCFTPSSIHASCEDYRASATVDLQDDEADIAAGRKLEVPLLALWGLEGFVGRKYDVIEEWRERAEDVRGRGLDCGHYLPEEAPEETLRELLEFFS